MGRVDDLDIQKTQFSLGGSVNSCQTTNFSFLLPLLCTTFTKSINQKRMLGKGLVMTEKNILSAVAQLLQLFFNFFNGRKAAAQFLRQCLGHLIFPLCHANGVLIACKRILYYGFILTFYQQ